MATIIAPERPTPPPEVDSVPQPVTAAVQAPDLATTPILSCSGLVKTFGPRRAVDDVSFSIGPGETYGLLGPNGAGKTTTISMVCGILRRDAGTVLVDGLALEPSSSAVKGAIGYVPQDLAIYPDLTARENLRFFGRLYGLGHERLAARVDEVLRIVDLADRANERTEHYSGGMKRRLNIAIGLLHEPRLLILDEPTVGVDPQSRNAILTSVEALSDEGMGILYTTHYMEEAERLCDRVGIIDEGRIIAEGTRRELVALVGELDKVSLSADGDLRSAAAELRGLDGIRSVSLREGGLDLLVPDARVALPVILAATTHDGVKVRSVEVVEPDLEAVFLHLTGKGLRD